MTEKPEPMTPPDSDLKDFPFTPIYRSRLFGSEFHANANDSEWRAGVTLWLKSWDQVPAGSLPTDDIALCRLAEFGRDMKGWQKVKARALHGWTECSDGRMYHEVVAGGVNDAFERRRKASVKGKAGAAKRHGAGNATATENLSTGNQNDKHRQPNGVAQAVPGPSNRQGQGERQGQVEHEPVTKPSGSETSDFGGSLATGAAASPGLPSAGEPAGPGCSEGDDGFSRADFDRLLVKLPQRQRGSA